MLLVHALLVFAAGLVAGAINTVVGSGSLVSYPVLLLVGLPPVAANIANTIGLAPGALAGAVAYRHEIRTTRKAALRLFPLGIIGAISGAALLLSLPSTAFRFIVPVLILISVALIAFQPMIRNLRGQGASKTVRWPLAAAVLIASVYGGYFSAAQGIILLGVLGIFLDSTLQQQNGLKNLLQAVVNVVAACFLILNGGIDWLWVSCLAAGGLAGAPLGAQVAKHIQPEVFRISIIVFGTVVAAILVGQLVTSWLDG